MIDSVKITIYRTGAPRAWLATDAVALTRRQPHSENAKPSHQFLARFHRLLRIHPAEHFFPTLTIHCCEFAHELVARFPFRVFGRADAECEKPGDDPNADVGRGDEKHKKRKNRLRNPHEIVFVFETSSSNSTQIRDLANDVDQAFNLLTPSAGCLLTGQP